MIFLVYCSVSLFNCVMCLSQYIVIGPVCLFVGVCVCGSVPRPYTMYFILLRHETACLCWKCR